MKRSFILLSALLILGGCQQQGIEGKWALTLNLDGKPQVIHVSLDHGGTWTGQMTSDATTVDDMQVPAMTAKASGTWNLTSDDLTFVTNSVDVVDIKGPLALAKKPIEDKIQSTLKAYEVSKAKLPDPFTIQITTASGENLAFHRE